MARNLLGLLSATALLVISLNAPANEPPADPPMPDIPQKMHKERHREHPKPPPRDSKIDREQREKNMERWKNLPPERREAMRRAARERVERMQAELNGLIEQAGGDQLDPARRKQIEERYLEARRELEQRLRQQMEETREQELPKILESIKAEFEIE